MAGRRPNLQLLEAQLVLLDSDAAQLPLQLPQLLLVSPTLRPHLSQLNLQEVYLLQVQALANFATSEELCPGSCCIFPNLSSRPATACTFGCLDSLSAAASWKMLHAAALLSCFWPAKLDCRQSWQTEDSGSEKLTVSGLPQSSLTSAWQSSACFRASACSA